MTGSDLGGLRSGDSITANAYLGTVAVTGGVMWAANAAVKLTTHHESASHAHEAGVELFGASGLATAAWLALFAVWVGLAVTKLDRRTWASGPMIAWFAICVVAFVANVAGLFVGSAVAATLMWLPWLGAMAVGYLMTGVLARRGGIYLVFGALSGTAFVVASGVVPVEVAGLSEASVRTFLLLGTLHVVPIAVDAARGGREMTDDGIPVVRAQETEDVSVVGD